MKFKKEFEKLLIWYVPLVILAEGISGFSMPMMFRSMAKFEDFIISPANLFLLRFILISLPHVAAGIWLWIQSKKENGRFMLWAGFGLASGLWAIAFYILFHFLGEKKLSSETSDVS